MSCDLLKGDRNAGPQLVWEGPHYRPPHPTPAHISYESGGFRGASQPPLCSFSVGNGGGLVVRGGT